MSPMDLPSSERIVEGYVLIDDIAPGTSGEQLMRDRLRAAGPNWESISVMLVLTESPDGSLPLAFMNAGISVDGSRGMLQWRDMTGEIYVPSAAHNPVREGWIDFRHPTNVVLKHPAVMGAPVSLVYQAVDELIATRGRPSCVTWEPFRQ